MLNKKKNEEITNEWRLYTAGVNYSEKIGYKAATAKNERFYEGDQWSGVKAGNLPTPVFNIFKRIIDYTVAYISSSPVKVSYTTGDVRMNEILNNESATIWENSKMDFNLRRVLLKGALSGDMCAHVYWDSNAVRPNGIRGDFRTEIIDGANVFFGDVTSNRTENQPYMLLCREPKSWQEISHRHPPQPVPKKAQ